MKFSSIVTFLYNKKHRKVLVLKNDVKKNILYGIELSNINSEDETLIIKLYNNEIFMNRMYDEQLVKLARNRSDKIEEQELAEDIFIGAGLISTIKQTKIKNLSASKMIMLLRRQFRIFDVTKVKEISYVETT